MDVKKIKFGKTEDGYWYGSITIGHFLISITAGKFNYSIPFETIKDPYSYDNYEVIVSNRLDNNRLVTHEYFPHPKGKIAPYVSPDDIFKIVNRIREEVEMSELNKII